MQAVILAGGLGTRLRQIAGDRPKPLVDMDGKPFLEYQIEFLKKYHITDLILCIGYLGEKIERHFLTGADYGVSIIYSREGNLLGTGGALKNARELLHKRFFVLNGDTIFLINLSNMEKFHEQNSADATLALTKVNDQSQYGSVNLEFQGNNRYGNRIVGFSEKSSLTNSLINAGIYVIEKDLFRWADLPEAFSLETHFLPSILQTSRVCGFVDERAYFVDIGTVVGYRKLEEDLKLRKIMGVE
ncbi:MAG: nucleotidyltransferase family protein [Thermoproteota archaeon]|nr:nucleotidyltransferase family protein [Thermoproteota archaeon]